MTLGVSCPPDVDCESIPGKLCGDEMPSTSGEEFGGTDPIGMALPTADGSDARALAACSNASAISFAESYRSLGSFLSIRTNHASTAGGKPGRKVLGAGKTPMCTDTESDPIVSPPNGTRPVSAK